MASHRLIGSSEKQPQILPLRVRMTTCGCVQTRRVTGYPEITSQAIARHRHPTAVRSMPDGLVLQFGEQHFGLRGQGAGAVDVAGGQGGFGLLDELADVIRGLLVLVAQSPVDLGQAALGCRD